MNDLFNDKLGSINGIKQEDEYNLGLDDNFDLLKYANDPTLAQAAQLPKVTQFNQTTTREIPQPPKPQSSHTHLQHLLSSDLSSIQSELQLTHQTQLKQQQQQQTIKLEPKPEPTNSPPPTVTTVNTALLNAVQQSQLPQNLTQLLQAQLSQQLVQQQQQVQTTTQVLQQQAINLLTQQTPQPTSPPAVTQTVQTTPTQNVKTQKTILAMPVQQQQAITTASSPAQIIINTQPQQPAVGTVGQVNLQQLQQVLHVTHKLFLVKPS